MSTPTVIVTVIVATPADLDQVAALLDVGVVEALGTYACVGVINGWPAKFVCDGAT